MPNTTNYNWATPADSDLVKDGAAAIRTLGSSIDSTLKTQIDAVIPDALLTTTGDTIYASGASTPARLAVGSTGQVLTVAGGVPTWATASSGGMTLLSTTTLSGLTTISSIDQNYKNLYGVVFGVSNATAGDVFQLRPNGATSSTSYVITDTSNGTVSNTAAGATYYGLTSATNYLLNTNTSNAFEFTISNYASTTAYKSITSAGGGTNQSSAVLTNRGSGLYRATTAITSIAFNNTGGSLNAGTVLLYGVK